MHSFTHSRIYQVPITWRLLLRGWGYKDELDTDHVSRDSRPSKETDKQIDHYNPMPSGGEHHVEGDRGSPKNGMKVSLIQGRRISEQPSLRRRLKWALFISVIFLSPWLHHDDMPKTPPLSGLEANLFLGTRLFPQQLQTTSLLCIGMCPENSSSFNRLTFKYFINLNRARICHKGELVSLLFPFTHPQQFHNTHRVIKVFIFLVGR